jgi:hypothetical protein
MRILVLALVALVSGAAAAAHSGVSRPHLAPRVFASPRRVEVRPLPVAQRPHASLGGICRRARQERERSAARQPAYGSPARIYIPWLKAEARRETRLAAWLAKRAPKRYVRLARARARLAHSLVRAAERRDPAAWVATTRALRDNLRAERRLAHEVRAGACVG